MSGIYGTNGANRAAAAGKINGYSDLKPLKQLKFFAFTNENWK